MKYWIIIDNVQRRPSFQGSHGSSLAVSLTDKHTLSSLTVSRRMVSHNMANSNIISPTVSSNTAGGSPPATVNPRCRIIISPWP